MSRMGEFYVVEGVDGSGKTYQANLLSKWLSDIGIRNVLTEEHWKQDVLGQAIDTVVELKQAKLDPLALQMTFLANRVNHTSALIIPSLAAGYSVVTGRYLESTINYAKDEDREFLIEQTEKLMMMGKILRPNLTILIDVPVDEAIVRLGARRLGVRRAEQGDVPKELTLVSVDAEKIFRESIFEKRPKLERVRDNYLERFNGSDDRMIIVDGVGTIEEVHERLKTEIKRRCLSLGC